MITFRYFKHFVFVLATLSLVFSIAKDAPTVNVPPGTEAIIGEYGTLGNPINDRAKGFLLQGMVKSATTNYGNFISGNDSQSFSKSLFSIRESTIFLSAGFTSFISLLYKRILSIKRVI